MPEPLPSLRMPPIGFAHRGARADAPENTIEAFTLARRLGATGLESDVWLTADGEAVLDHDGVVRSGVRRRPIGGVRRADLPSHIPTLAELYDAEAYQIPGIKRSIIRYFDAATKDLPKDAKTSDAEKLPEHVKQAQQYLAAIEKKDPETVKSVKQFLILLE